jgi:hypothetical protein
VWSDDDVVELSIEVSDGISSFSNRAYVGHEALGQIASNLVGFKDQVYGGILDVRVGEFGPEYANGAFHGRLHFTGLGRLHITCEQESDFTEFGKKNVASRATMYLSSEPALLDRFIEEMRALATGAESAFLEALRSSRAQIFSVRSSNQEDSRPQARTE